MWLMKSRWQPEREDKSNYKTKAESEVRQHCELQKEN